jgi:hypothetical protein
MAFDLNALSEAISSLKTNISNSYNECESKGATMPTEKTSSNLADCIKSIPSGGSTPSVDMNAQPCSYFNVTWAEITDPSDVPQQFTIDFSSIGVTFKSIVIYSATNDGYFSITRIDSTKCVISAHPFIKYQSESIYGVTDMGEGTYRANYVTSGNSITFTRANYENEGVNYPGSKYDNFRNLPVQIAEIDTASGQVDYMLELINVMA